MLPFTNLFLPVATFLGLTRNTNKTTETNKEIAEKQQVNQLKLAYLNIQSQKDLEENRQYFQVNLEESRQHFQERMSHLGFKQQLALREFDQQFQLRLRELDHQHQQEVEEFRAQVNMAISQNNLDFQAWKFEQEVNLQKEITMFNRETQLAIAAYQRETALQLPEINKIVENWPLILQPTQILNSHSNHLRIFISPPELDYDRFTNLTDSKNHGFPKIESFLGSRLSTLVNKHYPRNNESRPTQLVDGAWDSKRFRGSASIIALTHCLESEPLIVLETVVTLNKYLSLRVAYKGSGQKEYFYDEVIQRFDYGKILLEIAKKRAGGVTESDSKIQIVPEDWEMLYELLEVSHCIVAAWIADCHHLIYNNASPLLPQLLPELIKELPDFFLTDIDSVLMQLMHTIIEGYQDVFLQLGKTERSYQVPGLFLDLAQGLSNLSDQTLAKEQIRKSITVFLSMRNCTKIETIKHKELMEHILVVSDRSYFQKLKEVTSLLNSKHIEAYTILRTWDELIPKLETRQILDTSEPYNQQKPDKQSSSFEYHNLIAFPPKYPNSKVTQWFHKSSFEHCEGKLQIGDNSMIRCERCDTRMPILEWYIVDECHLSEIDFGGKQIDDSDAMSFSGQLVTITGQKWMSRFLSNIAENDIYEQPQSQSPPCDIPNSEQSHEPSNSESEYYDLIAFPPKYPNSKVTQWFHKSSFEHCEGKLQIGDNSMIRCERCDTRMPILEWYIVDECHLSEIDFGGKQIDDSDAMSFSGQLVTITGQKWMSRFLSKINC